ncbi:DUF362 domain-containing protein [Aquisphaera insulae]|uniref:DUF362 domain-containing protein n=1 Tax=Aquisphaera insulae TaxID=2712864 RepID=UPI0013EB1F80|nr:DUF362 domain-containing protein [Aquisphaera insulae]
MKRRSFLTAAGAIAAGGLGLRAARSSGEAWMRSSVFVGCARSYSEDLEPIIAAGLSELGLGPDRIRGKTVLLKPNLVEPVRAEPQINTHPAVVRAAAEVFRRGGAREVLVAEGQGHCRDSRLVLDESGLGSVLAESHLEFVDLNHDDVVRVPNGSRFTELAELVLPATLRRADLIVSMPKMKTHHWAGVTLSMKNLFGVMPGVCYGWPKNVLHHAGIPQSIIDINAAVRPHLAIVDGIIGMEGDGPIMGTPKPAGLLVMGTNFPAVDATCARLMGIDPARVAYLAASSGFLGPIKSEHIAQRGELIGPLVQPFRLLDHPSLAQLRARG